MIEMSAIDRFMSDTVKSKCDFLQLRGLLLVCIVTKCHHILILNIM